MKRMHVLCLFLILLTFSARAQFTAGAEGFHIVGGTAVVIDSLTLVPSEGLTITNNSLALSYVPIDGNPTGSIERVYTFDVPIIVSGTVGILFGASELNGNTEENLQISYSGSESGAYSVTSGSTEAEDIQHVYNTFNDLSLWSVTAANSSTSLPVTLVDFRVSKESESAVVAWSTTSETNSKSFEVQRSQNAKNWEILSVINARGESKEIYHYSYVDSKPRFNGNNFYRLKMIDNDETFVYSTIRQLSFVGVDLQATVYPNPTVEKLLIRVNDWNTVKNVQIINLQGVVVYDSLTWNDRVNDTAEVNVRSLASGTYVVKINRLDGTVNAVKIIRH